MNATVLVTGGNGFVGSHCIVELLRQGFQVRATLRDLSKEAPARTAIAATGAPLESLSFVAVQLTQDAGWDTALHGCDYVLHVASPLGASQPNDPNELIVPARDGTLRVLAAAARAAVKRVVMTACLRAARRRCPRGRLLRGRRERSCSIACARDAHAARGRPALHRGRRLPLVCRYGAHAEKRTWGTCCQSAHTDNAGSCGAPAIAIP
jgi:NAD(P)-dependent dehydrogenase (short-subunit alcohol dehydrogenase family)